MPRSGRRCCAHAPARHGKPSAAAPTQVEDWKRIRRRHLREMKRCIRYVVFFMALWEVALKGLPHMVYAGKQGYPPLDEHDFGIAYTVGHVLAWLYLCVFSVLYVPLFSWWMPAPSISPDDPILRAKVIEFLSLLIVIAIPVIVGANLVFYVWHAIKVFIYVDSRPVGSERLPRNTSKNWLARFFMLLGIGVATTMGYGAFHILAFMDLAHVKSLEYAIIVVPVQINAGILLGTVLQFHMENRWSRRRAALLETAKRDYVPPRETDALLKV